MAGYFFLTFICKNVQIQNSHFRGAIFGSSCIFKNLQMELVAHCIHLLSLKQYNFWSVNERDWRDLVQEINLVKICPFQCKLCIMILVFYWN